MPVDVVEQVQRFNWVDWVVVAVVVMGILGGIQRGFLSGALDLLGLGVTLVAAVVGYAPVAGWLESTFDIPRALASVVALVGIAVLAQTVYWWLFAPLLRTVDWIRRSSGVLLGLDRLLGVATGAAQGLILAGLALLPFGFVPMVPSVTASIERSVVGGWLVATAAATAPELEARLGRDLSEGLTFVAPPQTEDASRPLDLGRVGTLEPDPEAEQRMFELLNQERERAGLRAVTFDNALREVARVHSREMFERSYFSHVSPYSGTPADRATRAGIMPRLLGENLAYAPNVRVAHEGLMNSPGHRANILRDSYGRVGIGVIKSQFRGSMFTQNFRD
jgi:uncharacterized protein YkwD/uncharacterized membrane protein required for colicin V production